MSILNHRRHIRRKVAIIFTGGTLGMEPDPETGSLRPVPGFLTKQMAEMPELQVCAALLKPLLLVSINVLH